MKWISRLLWFVLGLTVGLVIVGGWTYISVGAIPLLGGLIQAKMCKTVKQPFTGNGAKPPKKTFRPGGH